jgi:hypothetical protein
MLAVLLLLLLLLLLLPLLLPPPPLVVVVVVVNMVDYGYEMDGLYSHVSHWKHIYCWASIKILDTRECDGRTKEDGNKV